MDIKQGKSFRIDDKDKSKLKEFLANYPEISYYIDEKENICYLPEPYVGILELPTRTINILPRIDNIKLRTVEIMYYLVNSDNFDPLDSESIFDLEESSFNLIIAKKFVEELDKIIQEGIPHLYKEKEEGKIYIKGKINIVKTFNNLEQHKAKPFVCKYEEVTVYNSFSKIMGAALYKIEYLLINDFIRLAPYLPYCTEYEGKILLKQIKDSKESNKYSKALNWAKIILHDLHIYKLGVGQYGAGFLINFDLLFQNFCYKVLKLRGREYNIDTGKLEPIIPIIYGDKEINLSGNKIIPDIMYKWDSLTGIAECVIDCKCKSNYFSSEDIYQIEFYSSCVLAKRGILIYPTTSYQDKQKVFKIQDNLQSIYLKRIDAVYLNLDTQDYSIFIKNINKFTEDICSLLTS